MRTNSPAPCKKTFIAVVVTSTENIFVVRHQFASRVVNNILCVSSSFLKVVIVELTADTSLCKIYFCQKSLCTIVVNASTCTLGLRQQFHSLFQSQDNVIIYITFLYFWSGVIVAFSQSFRVAMDNRYISKCTNKIEISHSLPCQTFTHALCFYAC